MSTKECISLTFLNVANPKQKYKKNPKIYKVFFPKMKFLKNV